MSFFLLCEHSSYANSAICKNQIIDIMFVQKLSWLNPKQKNVNIKWHYKNVIQMILFGSCYFNLNFTLSDNNKKVGKIFLKP